MYPKKTVQKKKLVWTSKRLFNGNYKHVYMTFSQQEPLVTAELSNFTMYYRFFGTTYISKFCVGNCICFAAERVSFIRDAISSR